MEKQYSLNELSQIATAIIKNSTNKCILFYGKMGVGKTTLIKEIVKQLGSEDNVSSPTFSLVNEYEADDESIFHFDFYRIEDEEEALDIGIEEYFDNETWVLIEWPEKINSLLPQDAQKIYLERKKGLNHLKMI